MMIGIELRQHLRSMTQQGSYKRMIAAVVFAAAAMVGCEGEEIDDQDVSGLKISLSDYRYGTQEIGSRTPQVFEIANVGVDTYPVTSVVVGGEHPGDFKLVDLPDTTLEPGDQMQIEVSFSPVGEGPRNGLLNLNYSIIAGYGSNTVESIYYSAKTAEDSGDTVEPA